jgi:hypothetical protein
VTAAIATSSSSAIASSRRRRPRSAVTRHVQIRRSSPASVSS